MYGITSDGSGPDRTSPPDPEASRRPRAPPIQRSRRDRRAKGPNLWLAIPSASWSPNTAYSWAGPSAGTGKGNTGPSAGGDVQQGRLQPSRVRSGSTCAYLRRSVVRRTLARAALSASGELPAVTVRDPRAPRITRMRKDRAWSQLHKSRSGAGRERSEMTRAHGPECRHPSDTNHPPRGLDRQAPACGRSHSVVCCQERSGNAWFNCEAEGGHRAAESWRGS